MRLTKEEALFVNHAQKHTDQPWSYEQRAGWVVWLSAGKELALRPNRMRQLVRHMTEQYRMTFACVPEAKQNKEAQAVFFSWFDGLDQLARRVLHECRSW